jgi:putative phosphoribosyl transferase
MTAFRDRTDAAARLAAELVAYHGQRPLVLAVPRGGVPLGRVLADTLGGDLDVVLVHKIGAPHQPELAIGAVDEHGHVVLDPLAGALGISAREIEATAAHETAALRARRAALGTRPPADPAGRVVIIVDDGIATGATVRAAIRTVRTAKPARVIVATPVAPPDTVASLSAEADAVVTVLTPPDFQAVGQYYDDFSPVGEDQVAAALR